MTRAARLVVCSMFAAGTTLAQPDRMYVSIEGAGLVTPSVPSIDLIVFGGLDPLRTAFIVEAGTLEFGASEGRLSAPWCFRWLIAPFPFFRYNPGTISPEGDRISDIIAGQFEYQSSAKLDNPLELWGVIWSTTDFTPRTVELWADNGERFTWATISGIRGSMDPDPSFATIIVRTDCLADLDGNAALDVFDYFAFQNFFMDASPVADLDADGELTIFDFLMFQNAFDAGC